MSALTEQLSEKLLLFQVRVHKDPEAFAKLYDRYVNRIYRFVYFKVGRQEDAEDIASEVFLKAWNYIRDHREVKSFSGLLYRVARNAIIDFYRANKSHPETISTSPGEDNEEFDIADPKSFAWFEEIHAQVEAKAVLAALKKLKQEYQEVITLRYVDELNVGEIAEITGKSSVAVRVTLFRATKKLQEILK